MHGRCLPLAQDTHPVHRPFCLVLFIGIVLEHNMATTSATNVLIDHTWLASYPLRVSIHMRKHGMDVLQCFCIYVCLKLQYSTSRHVCPSSLEPDHILPCSWPSFLMNACFICHMTCLAWCNTGHCMIVSPDTGFSRHHMSAGALSTVLANMMFQTLFGSSCLKLYKGNEFVSHELLS